jgi:hypothetical protein
VNFQCFITFSNNFPDIALTLVTLITLICEKTHNYHYICCRLSYPIMAGVKVKILYTKKNGHSEFHIQYSDYLLEQLDQLFGRTKTETRVELYGEVRAVKEAKTAKQIRYYYGLVIPAICNGLKDAGYNGITEIDVHQFLKDRFYYKEVLNENTGELLKFSRTLAESDINEMSEFIDNCIRFAEDALDIIVPPPPPKE